MHTGVYICNGMVAPLSLPTPAPLPKVGSGGSGLKVEGTRLKVEGLKGWKRSMSSEPSNPNPGTQDILLSSKASGIPNPHCTFNPHPLPRQPPLNLQLSISRP